MSSAKGSFNIFIKKYKKMYPYESEIISKQTYGRHKMSVIKSMTRNELIRAFQNHKYIGAYIKPRMSKSQIIVVLKSRSSFF